MQPFPLSPFEVPHLSRIKLDLPEPFHFSTEIPIRIGDINYGGHLGHDSVLSIVHEARVRLLHHHGYSEKNVGGTGLIVSDVAIVYKSEAFYGETCVVEISVGGFTRTGCDFLYRVSERETHREVARAKTGVTFFDYDRRKPAKAPEDFRRIFEPGSEETSS